MEDTLSYITVLPIITESFRLTDFDAFLSIAGEKPTVKEGRLFIPPTLLRQTAEECFRQLAFYLRERHLRLLSEAPDPSPHDRLVLQALLDNADIACQGELALCQDTGTAIVYGWKDESVCTGCDDAEELAQGALTAYQTQHLRASQVGFESFFDEYNTGTNAPAQVHIAACPDSLGGPRYRFLLVAKGGGSSNKTAYFSLTKAFLEPERFERFLEEQISALGTAACPPYRLAVVVGGTSPEQNLEILKLATTEVLDPAPFEGASWIRRDRYWEERTMDMGKRSGLGAQFGGTNLLLDTRVLRLPRHAASCPVSIGVSCAAHRNMLGFIDADGIHLERLCRSPSSVVLNAGEARQAPCSTKPPVKPPVNRVRHQSAPHSQHIDLNVALPTLCSTLSQFSVGDRLLLSGSLLVARDAAHQKWYQEWAAGRQLPDYLMQHPIFYAGPSAPPPGKITGSIGPTTAGRMDYYADALMSAGASRVTIAKGNRSQHWVAACQQYGGFYLGTIGGAAALVAEKHITGDTVIDYPELGMEAVRRIEVCDLPVFVITDDKGNDWYRQIADKARLDRP
jgi:fumarate hydratase class I